MEEENKTQQQPNQEVQQEFSQTENKSMGAVLGSIIVVIILLVAAFYLWGNRPEGAPEILQPDEVSTTDTGPTVEEILKEDAQTKALETQGESDELASIEEDLNATDLEDLTSELEDIDKELGL